MTDWYNMASNKKPVMNQIAVQTIRDRYASYPSRGLTPERLARIFKEADQGDIVRQAELFEEMEEKDLHLAGCIQTRKLAVAGLDWEILPASDDPQDKVIADAAKEMIEYIENWDNAVVDMLDAIGKGFSVCEIIWELAEGKYWVKTLDWVHQKRFTFNSPDVLLSTPKLLTDANPVWGEELVPYKFVVHTYHARSGATPRGGLLRPCAWMYLFKNYDIKAWMTFNELYSVPMRLGKYQAGASAQDIEALKQAVFNMAVDAAAVISDSTLIELVESKVSGNTTTFMDLINFCDKAISKAVLGHAGSVEGTPGKLGGEDQAKNIRQDLLESDAKALMKTIKFQILAPWVRFNYGPDKAVPKFKFHFECGEDLEKTARVYGILVKDVGYNKIGIKHIQERFGIPEPEKGEETIGDLTPDVRDNPVDSSLRGNDNKSGGNGKEKIGDDKEHVANKAGGSGDRLTGLIAAQHYIDALAGQAVIQGTPDMTTISGIVDEAASYDDLQEKLADLYRGIDMKQFEDVLSAALALADLKGRTLE